MMGDYPENRVAHQETGDYEPRYFRQAGPADELAAEVAYDEQYPYREKRVLVGNAAHTDEQVENIRQ